MAVSRSVRHCSWWRPEMDGGLVTLIDQTNVSYHNTTPFGMQPEYIQFECSTYICMTVHMCISAMYIDYVCPYETVFA